LQSIRFLVLDETIGDPSLIFGNPKRWKRNSNLVSSMSGLRVLYINVDTLYPRAWTSDREERLLAPIRAIQVPELHLIVRWRKSETGLKQLSSSTEEVTQPSFPHPIQIDPVRIDSYDGYDLRLYQDHPAADMRAWIIGKLQLLGANAV
jgi:hypothetical protein